MTTQDQGDTHMPRRRGSRPYINRPPRDLPPGAPMEAALVEFGAKLQKLMYDKGMNQSDLARAAAKFMPDKKFTRDNVSNYIRGNHFPYPLRLNALARALGVTIEELRPKSGIPQSGDHAPALDFRSLGDGNVWLRVNQAGSMDVAMKIVAMLEQDHHGTDKGK